MASNRVVDVLLGKFTGLRPHEVLVRRVSRVVLGVSSKLDASVGVVALAKGFIHETEVGVLVDGFLRGVVVPLVGRSGVSVGDKVVLTMHVALLFLDLFPGLGFL